MTYRVEVAQAIIPYPDKGHDASCIRRVGENLWLLAVADGLTMNDGGTAAHWAIEHMSTTQAHFSSRSLYADLVSALAEQRVNSAASQTTLTAGLLKIVSDDAGEHLQFDYFAAGDSPIWCVFRSGGDPPYQRFQVHGAPFPAQPGRVYSTLRLASGDVSGTVAFGSIDIALDEVLVVCSDGLPERAVFSRDFQRVTQNTGYIRLCDWLYRKEPYTDDELEAVVSSYSLRGDLSDDATLLVARLATVPEEEGAPHPLKSKRNVVRRTRGALRHKRRTGHFAKRKHQR